jgi:lysyl-tRNA synthetase class 2
MHNALSTPHSERDVRIQKVATMKELGVLPFAQSYDKTHLIAEIIQQYEKAELRDIEMIIPSPILQVSTAGRMTLYRNHGKLAFARLLDSTEQIQLMFHRDNCTIRAGNNPSVADNPSSVAALFPLSRSTAGRKNKESMTAYKFMEKMVDVGDFIGVKGEVFRTHKGELTIFVSEFSFLSKSIRGLPEKYH